MDFHGYLISYIESVPCIKWAATKEANYDFFKGSVEESKKMYQKEKVNHDRLKILIDLTYLSKLNSEDLQWFNNEVMTELNYVDGVSDLAIVKPRDIMAHVYFNELQENNVQIHNVNAFDTNDEAMAWLKYESCKVPRGGIDVFWDF